MSAPSRAAPMGKYRNCRKYTTESSINGFYRFHIEMEFDETAKWLHHYSVQKQDTPAILAANLTDTI
jgi:hypothetical protein